MSTYRLLFIGDVVGRPGREALAKGLRKLQAELEPLFTVVNGENAAAGVGITPELANEIFALNVDAITLGNHAFHKREILPYLDGPRPIVRPANVPPACPGRGVARIRKGGIDLAVINLCGRVYMESYDDPFRAVDALLAEIDTAHILLDFHAEATSEKIAMAYHLSGRVSAVVGTHTHVTTADERILPEGTAAITDVGMTGPAESVLGMDRDLILRRFRTGLPERFEVAKTAGVISGVVIDVEMLTGKAHAIERVRRTP
jgi:metallophosphoesterase (TIGR00282 family)